MISNEEGELYLGSDQMVDTYVPTAITDTGCERELNEDRYAVIESPTGTAWVVCDGMGGAAGGELAAQLAIDAMRRDLENCPRPDPESSLRSAILEANRVIVLRRQNQAFAGMGTTVVAALFSDRELVLSYVGDSRAYLVRDRAIQLLTTDHTYVQKLVERGEIRHEDALTHPQAHILTKAVGSEPGLEVDQLHFWIWPPASEEKNDFLMLCTDGLYSLVTEGEMANLISEYPPQRAAVNLIELAKSRGGYDNITIAVIPLNGQLHREPPAGYRRKTKSVKLDSRRSAQLVSRSSLLKTILLIGLLSVLSFLLTVIFVVLHI